MRIPAALLAAAVLVLGSGAAPAAASVGSVPVVVTDYATSPDGLVSSLEDFFGPGADGKGIEFDDSTEIGAVDRVFDFSPKWLAGAKTGEPVALANQWTAPVSVGGKPLGVAIIWINPGTVQPQLADFIRDPDFAAGLADVAADAWIVSDEPRGAWFVLAPPTLTPLVSGTSGHTAAVNLAAYQGEVTTAAEQPTAEAGMNLGSLLSIVTISGIALVVVLALLIPYVRRRRAVAEPEGDEPEVAANPPIT